MRGEPYGLKLGRRGRNCRICGRDREGAEVLRELGEIHHSGRLAAVVESQKIEIWSLILSAHSSFPFVGLL